ncbi:DUF3137 domain-containing protein [Mycobacterium manitobense]|uniref:DUF3137 domain-containing protein n=1 Tax=[Mycobacterium] manitobense TaxID=190147 RepID=A0A9X3BWJ6_9MYCO|nr:DUF3137 domain-containing protein [[Mycobacterium] manitobense]MCV7171781.1 DUF3137 domain-containing protein [[Mycobacterium] manitobense]
MPPATFDHPLPYRSAIPAQRGLNVLTAGTFVALVAVQFAWWPALFGSILPSVTVALATPLLALVPSGMIIAGLRRREMRAWSRAHGFVHHRRPDWPVPQFDVAPFTVGRARRRRVADGMTGTVGRHPAWFIHYTWWNNNWFTVTSHFRNVFALTLPRALPALSIGPTIDPGAGSTVPLESIDFNDVWAVATRDERFARAVITPATMDRLLALDLPVTANTRISIVGRELLAISIGGNRGSDITRIYTALRIIADGIPPYVWDVWSVSDQEAHT